MDNAPLVDSASAQDDVLSRKQLTALGLGHDVVAAQLVARRWQRAGPRMVVLHNGPLTFEQRCWVAVLNAGTPSALAAQTAARMHGLKGFDDDKVHVLVPRGARVPRISGVRVHESRRFTKADIHPSRAPACVQVERAVVDLALWSPTPRRACAVLAAAVQQRIVKPAHLRTKVRWPATGKRKQLLLATLRDIEGGAEALSELDFTAYCRRHSLPTPRRQVVRRDATGRRRYLDAEFDGFSVEIDGAIHLRPLNAWADMDRHNSLLIVGERQLRFPSFLLYIDDPSVADRIREAAARFSQTVPRPKIARSA